jgi:hypothetical protein
MPLRQMGTNVAGLQLVATQGADFGAAGNAGKRGEPIVGLVGRVGWQNHQMLYAGLQRSQAVAQFKTWKIGMREKLGLGRSP